MLQHLAADGFIVRPPPLVPGVPQQFYRPPTPPLPPRIRVWSILEMTRVFMCVSLEDEYLGPFGTSPRNVILKFW